MSVLHRVRVTHVPPWLDWARLLGPGAWRASTAEDATLFAEAELAEAEAADLEARLRGVAIGGAKLGFESSPRLRRASVRVARAAEARRYRTGSPGLARTGARLDPEARRSLTPEALALALGERLRGARVIDAGCGAGGNAIGFARAGCSVTAIELDPRRLAMARHNAALYGVAELIRFVHGDARELVRELEADVLFVDPPWGEYDKTRATLADLPLLSSLLDARSRFSRLVAKLPPAFDPRCLPEAQAEAVFGVGEGDARRVKFLLLWW